MLGFCWALLGYVRLLLGFVGLLLGWVGLCRPSWASGSRMVVVVEVVVVYGESITGTVKYEG